MRDVDIQYFLEVANCLSLRRSAERLGISQPSLSASIKKLEQELGVKLFNRLKTGVNLTVSGQQLKLKANLLLETWQQVKTSVYDASHKIEGHVIIGCHPLVAMYHLPKAFPKLLIENPKLNIKIIHGLSREINQAIISGRCDIGIVVNPIRHPDLIIKSIRQDKVGFWMHHSFKANTKNITLLCDPHLNQTAELLKRLKQKNVSISRIIECQSLELLAKLASQKVGVAIIPESIAISNYQRQLINYQPSLFFPDDICIVLRHESRFVKSIEAIKNSIN